MSYQPFKYGIERGKNGEPCPTCGVVIANQHSLREAGKCDGLKNGKARRT